MKRRTTPTMCVRFNRVPNNLIDTIDFIFRQEEDETSEPVLKKTYPTEVEYDKLHNRYLVDWTAEETEMFLEDHEFFMDTRIKLKGSGRIPETNKVKLIMNGTLFDDNGEDD